MTLDTQITVGNLLTILTIMIGMISGYVKLSERLTRLETTMNLLLRHNGFKDLESEK